MGSIQIDVCVGVFVVCLLLFANVLIVLLLFLRAALSLDLGYTVVQFSVSKETTERVLVAMHFYE